MQTLSSFDHLAHFLAHNVMHQYRHNAIQSLEEIGHAIEDGVRSRIGIYQPGWDPLSPVTIERKQRLGYGLGGNPDTPLYATGEFFRDVSSTVNQSRMTTTIGTTLDEILYTELGTSKMPPRPIFEPTALEMMPHLLPRIQQLSAAGIAGVAVVSFPRNVFQGTVFTP